VLVCRAQQHCAFCETMDDCELWRCCGFYGAGHASSNCVRRARHKRSCAHASGSGALMLDQATKGSEPARGQHSLHNATEQNACAQVLVKVMVTNDRLCVPLQRQRMVNGGQTTGQHCAN
jgi:hypothetical protein